jgi:hypothetical protein
MPRTIEDLKGLAPPRDAPPEHVVEHFRQLDVLRYGPGCDPGHIARVMLTRGFPREPARLAILWKMTGGDPEAAAPLTRQALAQLVMAAGGIEAVVPDITTTLQQRTGWVAGVVDRLASMTVMGGRRDAHGVTIGPLEETQDQRLHVIANMFASAAVGEEPEDITPLSDLEALYDGKGKVRHDERGHYLPAQFLPEEEDERRDRLPALAQMASHDVFQVLATASLADLAEAAVTCRSTARTWRMLGGLSDDPEAIDDEAAMMAPTALLVGRENWPEDKTEGLAAPARSPLEA